MSWFRLALGLVREAASTEVGQGIINDLKENTFGARKEALDQMQDISQVRAFLEERMRVVDRNMEMLVQTLNAQHEKLLQIQKRQRIWNITVASGLLVTIAAALLI